MADERAPGGEQLNYAAEVMLDCIAAEADGKDDDELVFLDPVVRALADACGVDFTDEMPLLTAGEVRARARAGKGDLARG